METTLKPRAATVAPVVVTARPVHLSKKMTLEDAFRCIGLDCLAQMEANAGGVLARNVESLHQMRVGLRRLRALLGMFEDLAAPPAALSEGIAWLAGELGATRDWDVLADTTLNRVEGIDPAVVREAARAKAGKLHAHLLMTLDEPRFTKLMLQLNRWLRDRQWRGHGAPPKGTPLQAPVRRAVRPLLDKAEKRLGKRIAALDHTDAPARHRVRIAAKKARYAAEFFSDILAKKTVKPYVRALAALQDQLGLLNDMAVADRLLPELQHGSNELARQAAFARGYLLAAGKAEADRLRKPLEAVARLRMTRP